MTEGWVLQVFFCVPIVVFQVYNTNLGIHPGPPTGIQTALRCQLSRTAQGFPPSFTLRPP